MTTTNGDSQIIDSVKEYYGKKLKNVSDLQTQACVAPGRRVNKNVREAISQVHEEVASKYYGCGLVIPDKLEGIKVLDLGSGSGRDCFAISKLVGQNGQVTGIDMTDEQIEVARKYIDYHTKTFGYDKPNVNFVQGYIEKLLEAGLQENFYDLIVSNCVVNLSPDKCAVLSEAYKVLKEGGELYFSDVYCDRNLDDSVRKHETLWGECIAGALCWKDLISLAEKTGFSTPRLETVSPIPIDRDDFKKILGDAKFCSVTYRLFKLPKVEKSPPLQVIYSGDVTGCENQLDFDHRNHFKTGDVYTIDSELVTILKNSRFSDEFEFQPASKGVCETTGNTVDNPFDVLLEKEKKGEQVSPACCAPGKCC
ncbi:arsenite methyltransferase-like [Mytilus californianus]|uniref:arsenite methyltransferase-like n=1 Tax=Mytilus californianus TaxID=6549 RepID=UPI00224561AC|nr:arsenite methyltransferase-like [Mytilus californianus]XP_052099830.1 arsenite methyltransferase-like [Mytilus californianus]XP_052099831.1 arsenite methyltransferase-like [Mytilus californianus]